MAVKPTATVDNYAPPKIQTLADVSVDDESSLGSIKCLPSVCVCLWSASPECDS